MLASCEKRVRTTKKQIVLPPLRRLLPSLAALILVAAVGAQLAPARADATAQVTSRKIALSTSSPAATNVTYAVTFTPATSLAHPDVILDFCANGPLIGDACTSTAGTNTPNFTGAAATGWTLSTIGSGRGVKLTTASVNFTAATPTTITITGVTNPSNTASFYGRILTYTTGGASTNTSVSPGSYTDYGGVALSTTQNINITSTVYESLVFCVFQTACGTAPALTLGDPTTGALSTASAYINANAKYTIATNAGSGIGVSMTGTTLCRPGGSCATGSSAYTINAIGSTAVALATGTEQFGMCADTTGATGSLAAVSPYLDSINACHGLSTGTYAGGSKFGFDDTASTGTASTAGDQVMASTGAIATYTGSLVFLGDIAPTTEAGLYSTALNLVASGTF